MAQARALVAENGLEGLTFSSLESRLHFTRGVITYHFRNKDEIVDAVLESAVDEIMAETRLQEPRDEDVGARLAAIVASVSRGFLTRIEATRVLVSFWGQMQRDPRIRERNAVLYEEFRSATRGIIERGIERGELPADFDVHSTAALVVGTVIGVVTQIYFDPGRVDVDSLIASAQHTIRAGVGRPSPPGD